MRPGPALVASIASLLERARSFLEEISTVEERLVVTSLLAVLTLLVVVLVVPRVLGFFADQFGGRGVTGGVSRTLEIAGRSVPTTGREVVVRSVQVVLLSLTIATLGLLWGLGPTVQESLVWMGLSIPVLSRIGVTLLIVMFVFVASHQLEDSIATFSKGADTITDHQEEIFHRIGQLVLVVLALASALTIWGIDLSGLLVGAGFLGIVVGLAARQTLGSLIAGLVLMFSRPFTIGDWVEIGEQEGVVTEISIFNTRLENFDGEFVVLPNDTVSNSAITNRSQKGHLRIRVDVGIDYDADLERAETVALEAMDGVDLVDAGPPPQVIPKAFGDSAVVLELRFWIDRPTPPRKWQATSAVVSAVKAALEEADIKIPFPQREVSGRAETGGFRVRDAGQTADRDAPDGTGGAGRLVPPARDDGVAEGETGDGSGDDDRDGDEVAADRTSDE